VVNFPRRGREREKEEKGEGGKRPDSSIPPTNLNSLSRQPALGKGKE